MNPNLYSIGCWIGAIVAAVHSLYFATVVLVVIGILTAFMKD